MVCLCLAFLLIFQISKLAKGEESRAAAALLLWQVLKFTHMLNILLRAVQPCSCPHVCELFVCLLACLRLFGCFACVACEMLGKQLLN